MKAISAYQKELRQVMAKKCETCGGLGFLTDAEPGDIFYKERRCAKCRGTGYALTKKQPGDWVKKA